MGYRLPRQLVGVGVCLQFAWLLSAVPLAWAQNPFRSAWNQFDQFIYNFDPLGIRIGSVNAYVVCQPKS